jgi:hypothetical protein
VTPAERITALQVEAERIKARLDTLDNILAGSEDEWLGIQQSLNSDVATVTINAPLAEARQQALALATITKTLATLVDESAGQASGDPTDEFTTRREEKLREAQKAQA